MYDNIEEVHYPGVEIHRSTEVRLGIAFDTLNLGNVIKYSNIIENLLEKLELHELS